MRKILVVYDNEMNRDMLREMLCREYEIIEAENGKEALGQLESASESISAVLLDIIMPEMNGYEVLEHMRASEVMSPIPVIVTTGNTEEGAEVKALELGANDFIAKPYNPDIIKHRLSNTISLREKAAIINATKIDALTGLYSRAAFFEIVEDLVSKHESGYYVMACFDIEKFKVINDQYGSSKGDEVLKYLAAIFREGFDPVGGVCCRIMADNYAVLYPKTFMKSAAIEEIRRKAEVLDGTILPITFSIGRYIVDDISLSPSAMYDRATIAKSFVKGRFDEHIATFNESMRNRILEEQKVISEMKPALEADQFEVWFQPQYNHSSKAMIGAEALVRWRHPQRGLIAPGLFIPIFEKNGFVYEVDKYVWEHTCISLRKWLDAGYDPLPVSVNISRYDIYRLDLIDVISGFVKKYEIPIDLLRLEITESAFSYSSEQIIEVVRSFQKLGFTMEIDDFGSGYSSLNTLKDVPADVVKLDMKFLEGEDDSGRGGNILESIVRMTKWLGMGVIAEGVETVEQADFLLSIGCSYIQGYLYSKPIPLEEFEQILLGKNKERKRLALQTVENLDNSTFWNPKSMETLIFNSYVGGACIFEYYNGKVELLRANRKYAEVIGSAGMTIEDAIWLDWEQHMSPESKETVRTAIQKSLETREEVTNEYLFLNLPGCPEKTYLRTALRVIATAGERYLLYCTNENITAHVIAEQKLHELDAKLKSTNEVMTNLMNDTPGGFARMRICLNGNLATVYVNDVFCKLRGLSYDQIMAEDGESAMNSIHPDDVEKVRATVKEMMERHGTATLKYRLLLGNGEYAWFMVSGRMTQDEKGERFLNVYYTDLTEEEKNKMFLQLLTNNIPGGIAMFEVSPKGIKNVYHNEGFFSYSGYSKEEYSEIVQSNPLFFVYKEDVSEVERAIQSLMNNESITADCTYRCCTKSGELRYFNMRAVVSQKSGDVMIINVVQFDVTEEKQIEEDRRTREEEIRQRYEHELQLRHELISDSIIYYEMNVTKGIIEEYLSKCEDIPSMKSGSMVSDIMGKEILANVDERDTEIVEHSIFTEHLLQSYADGRTNFSVEYRRRLPDQIYYWVRTSITIVKRPDTEDIVAFIYVRNIDREKKNLLAMATIMDEEIESAIMLHLQTGMAHLLHAKDDESGLILNQVFEFDQEFWSTNRAFVYEKDQEICDRFFCTAGLQKALEKEKVYGVTYRVRIDGNVYRKTSRAYYLDESKEDIILIRQDITDLYEEEQKQRKILQKAVKEANHAKSDFLSNMSHDMRTPLNAVLAFSNGEITDKASEEQLREYLDKIHSSGDYLLGIINDVLDMSKIEQKKITLNPEPYAFDEFLKTIRNVIGELSSQKDIDFQVNSDNLEVHTLLVDKVRFNQIFINLLSNGIKFTPQGGKVELIMENLPRVPGQKEHVYRKRFIVKDNGIGMSPEFIPHAFESFKQEYRKDISEASKETGLGLAIVKELIHMMGGTISVESEMGKGSSFIVDLPLETIEDQKEIIKTQLANEQSLEGMHILLGEDNIINTEIAVTLLEKQGCIVDPAENGEKALARFLQSEEGYYDAILMDIRMPHMNGLEASAAIRASKRQDSKSIPIIAMTADAFTEDEQTAKDVGMSNYISKPIDPTRLFGVLRKYYLPLEGK